MTQNLLNVLTTGFKKYNRHIVVHACVCSDLYSVCMHSLYLCALYFMSLFMWRVICHWNKCCNSCILSDLSDVCLGDIVSIRLVLAHIFAWICHGFHVFTSLSFFLSCAVCSFLEPHFLLFLSVLLVPFQLFKSQKLSLEVSSFSYNSISFPSTNLWSKLVFPSFVNCQLFLSFIIQQINTVTVVML